MYLIQLEPGERFRVRGLPTTGVLLKCNECRARVRIDGTERETHFVTVDGKEVHFQSKAREEDWSPQAEVDVL